MNTTTNNAFTTATITTTINKMCVNSERAPDFPCCYINLSIQEHETVFLFIPVFF